VEKGRAVSVRLDNGEVIGLDGVLASNVDPRHLALDLLGEALPQQRASCRRGNLTWTTAPAVNRLV
jgi:hypothetical protein